MTWRDRAGPIIAKVLTETQGQDEKQIRKALREAYPFYERKYWPYKVWLDEIKRQRGLPRKPLRKGRGVTEYHNNDDQLELEL